MKDHSHRTATFSRTEGKNAEHLNATLNAQDCNCLVQDQRTEGNQHRTLTDQVNSMVGDRKWED